MRNFLYRQQWPKKFFTLSAEYNNCYKDNNSNDVEGWEGEG